MSNKITKAQAHKALAALERQFAGWIDEQSRPFINPDYYDGQYGLPIVWEGGPYAWVFLVQYGGIEEEFGTRIPEATGWPEGVGFEVLDNCAIALFRD